ncbi:MAG: GH-E family nuclease [Carboxylicivirga sp.]|nr:GH-E family nuclease [Carboxylicivirga sp.]
MPTHSDFANNIGLPNTAANAMQNFTQEYTYDELGNMMQLKSVGKWTRDYFYNFSQNNYLLGHTNGQTDYTYDAHGNMLSMPHLQAMHWDYNDWLTQADLDASGNKAYYVYNAAGERVRKVVVKGSVREERYYFGDYEIYRKFVSGVLETERTTVNISDDKKKIATAETLTIDQGSLTVNPVAIIRYQYDNHLGSASLELDETADIISYEEYHPFGTTSYRSGRTETETSQKRYKYVGKERDEETGLYYYGFRYYAAWLCRFVSVDPLQFEYPHYTPFQYAGNKPITYIDLDGLEEALTPYMERIEYVETNNIFDASHNILALLNNSLIVSTYNAASGIINAAYNYKETGKTIANSRLGEYVKTAHSLGPDFANTELAYDLYSFGGDVAKGISNTTWKDVGQSFTNWENYELAVESLVGAKGAGGAKAFGKKSISSKNSMPNLVDDLPNKNIQKISNRLKYMGSTPGKKSGTGKKVIERMTEEGKIRTKFGETEFLASNDKWYPLADADMAHKTDAVNWWNETGRFYGAKSKEVREFMKNSDNYYLEHYSINRSQGAKLKKTYLDPAN